MLDQQRSIGDYQGEDLLKAWREGLAEVSRSPKLMRQIEWHEGKLLPRFVEQYERLRALPRRVRRAIQRKWKHTLAGVALIMALGGGIADATTFNVPCPGGVGDNAALIQAIDDSNDEVANPGADTINLVTYCTHTLTALDNGTYGNTGLPVISSEITIDGNESTIQRDSGMSTPNFRIFAINGDGSLTLQESTVTGGEVSYSGGSGGGVANYSGTVTITNSTISYNVVYDGGGGVFNDSGTVTITESTISGNNAATYIRPGSGVFNDSGNVTITNSTISYNGFCFYSGSGGGVANYGGNITITNSTISGNCGARGIAAGGGVLNDSGTITLTRTLVSGNYAFTGPEIFNGGTITANNFNLFGYDGDDGVSGFRPGATDIVPSVALSAILNTTLADNGGFTQTNALVSGSPAVDAAGPNCPPPATDQRGVTRPQGAACDIGAFELQSSATPTPTPTSTATPTPGPPGRDSSGCSIAQSLESGSALANLLIPLLPIFAVGIKYLRRRLE